jgi:hypothetical protein
LAGAAIRRRAAGRELRRGVWARESGREREGWPGGILTTTRCFGGGRAMAGSKGSGGTVGSLGAGGNGCSGGRGG